MVRAGSSDTGGSTDSAAAAAGFYGDVAEGETPTRHTDDFYLHVYKVCAAVCAVGG